MANNSKRCLSGNYYFTTQIRTAFNPNFKSEQDKDNYTSIKIKLISEASVCLTNINLQMLPIVVLQMITR